MESEKAASDIIESDQLKEEVKGEEELFESLNIIEGDGSLENIHRVQLIEQADQQSSDQIEDDKGEVQLLEESSINIHVEGDQSTSNEAKND